MKTTVLDKLVMELQVWPENADYIAAHNGLLWQYQTKGSISGRPLSPAILAPSDPTGTVNIIQWQRAKKSAIKPAAINISWDGEGLPPVGAIIEFREAVAVNPRQKVWCKATVKYISSSFFVYIDDEGVERLYAHPENLQYRLFMAVEERYEHRKAKAVKALMDILDAPASEGITRERALEIIYAAIAAGDIPGVMAIKDDE